MKSNSNRGNFGFTFGENWSRFSETVDESSLLDAQESLANLISKDEIRSKKVCDVGSGSGIHALAFLTLGAKHVTCFDLDLNSVQTTQATLKKFNKTQWSVTQRDILKTNSNDAESYDIVYSWGVLHHTGNLNLALNNTQDLCAPNGMLILALYRKTFFCPFWKFVKRIYHVSPKWIRFSLDIFYILIFSMAMLFQGVNPFRYIRNYSKSRGMNFFTDVRDWLGGYPYESVSPQPLIELVESYGFIFEKGNISTDKWGFLGSGCNEYVFRKIEENFNEQI